MWRSIRTLLDRYPAACRPASPPESLGNAGGLSGSSLWRFRSGRGLLLARAWPVAGRGPEAIRRVHGWLARAGRLDFVPVPLADRDGRTLHEIDGRLWELTPWMPGAADLRRPPPPARLRAGFAALASFHQSLRADQTEGPSPGLAARLVEIERLRRGGLEEFGRVLSLAADDPRTGLALRWLASARSFAPSLAGHLGPDAARIVPRQPCLRDARPDHLLFEGDRLTGLVDFGAMDIDCVAADLARLLSEWVGPDRAARAEALSAYEAIRPLRESEAALIAAFERTAALLSGGHWIRWLFIERRVFDDPSAVEQGLKRAVERVADLAADL